MLFRYVTRPPELRFSATPGEGPEVDLAPAQQLRAHALPAKVRGTFSDVHRPLATKVHRPAHPQDAKDPTRLYSRTRILIR